MPPAARISDLHVCPMVDGLKPHVGGPVAVGCPMVMIGFMPAARVGDMCVCVGPPDVIAKGSPTVLIGGMMAARMGDLTAHGGCITLGFPTVMIGEMGMGGAVTVQGQAMVAAKKAGKPFCEQC
ncbi:MAG: PAAR domain-containing protein [Pirellulaceae bacterium]|nr:PAAR domain-containing protein [Pirellulaceae bacterium]